MNVFEKAQKIVQQQKDVYDAGYEKGKAEAGGAGGGYEEGFEAGRQAEYDAFWDEVQQNGNRTDYEYAFGGSGWNDKTFAPKYKVNVIKGTRAFRGCAVTDLSIYDIDTSQMTSANEIFHTSTIEHIGILDTRKMSGLPYFFGNCSVLHTIDKIILKSDGSQSYTSTFTSCSKLENIVFEGVVGKSGFDMQWSTKLTKASITSIVNALSTTTSGLSLTLSLAAVNNAFEGGSAGAEWTTLAGTRSNWTINLV